MSPRGLLPFFVLLLVIGIAAAQDAELSVGFDGEIVAGRWNPLEFSFRDQAQVTLTLTIDQGDLRSGPVLAVHTFQLTGGPGLTVLEQDIFVPAWQRFSWSASTSSRVIASGTFHPRDMDPRPLTVIMSTAAARHAGLLGPDSRTVALPSARLPERLSAWDGVALLLIDGTTAPPTAEMVVSAAAAGATVMLLEPLPASYAELGLLAGPLGAGRVLVGRPDELIADELATDFTALDEFIAARDGLKLPQPPGLAFVMPLALLYAVLTVVLWRLAGLPGAVAMTTVGVIAALLAWPELQSGPRLAGDTLTVRLSAGGLSRSVAIERVLDRSGGETTLPGQYRPVAPFPYRGDPDGTSLTIDRWRIVTLSGRPVLASAGSGAGEAVADEALLRLFPAGSTAVASEGVLEVFLRGQP